MVKLLQLAVTALLAAPVINAHYIFNIREYLLESIINEIPRGKRERVCACADKRD
jgi:hypothetical protein